MTSANYVIKIGSLMKWVDIMRIYDESICNRCIHFEHECYEEYCGEWCNCNNQDVKDKFYNSEDIIIECKSFIDWKEK